MFNEPQQCPRFEKCNAPICPLDRQWRERKYHQGERICFYLTEAMKANCSSRFANRADHALLTHAAQFISQMRLRFPNMADKFDRAAQTGSLIERASKIPTATQSQNDTRSFPSRISISRSQLIRMRKHLGSIHQLKDFQRLVSDGRRLILPIGIGRV